MTSYPERNFGHFEINPNDKITLHGRAMRLAYQTKSGYVLKELDVTGVSELFSFVTHSWLNFSNEIEREPDFFKPAALEPISQKSDLAVKASVFEAARDGVTFEREIAGRPSMKAAVERLFRSASKELEAQIVARGGKQEG